MLQPNAAEPIIHKRYEHPPPRMKQFRQVLIIISMTHQEEAVKDCTPHELAGGLGASRNRLHIIPCPGHLLQRPVALGQSLPEQRTLDKSEVGRNTVPPRDGNLWWMGQECSQPTPPVDGLPEEWIQWLKGPPKQQ
jgi:hypothetical protein